MWKCKECNREFRNTNQPHSCKPYALNEHFKNKDYAKGLYNELLSAVKKEVGPYKVESLSCCIHIVDLKTKITYFCVYALKDGIKLHFGSNKPLKDERILKSAKVSLSKYMHEMAIKDKSEIDDKLINWLKESNNIG